MRFLRSIGVLTVALFAAALIVPAAAHATAGDLYAAGTPYRVTTYANHRSVFGSCSDSWVADINANAGDAGRPIYAPEAGNVRIFSTGWGDGFGNSIIWLSADEREQIHVAHLSAFAATGDVAGGALIGYAGSTGNSTGDHMHVSRAYDGVPAPLILSGQQIAPASSGLGTQYTSAGQLPVTFSVCGVTDQMAYYGPVGVTYSCTGAEASTLAATLDGAPFTSGSAVGAYGTHTLVVTASLGGCAYSKTVTFTVAEPPAPGLEPVFRFYRPSAGTHFFTNTYAERDNVVTSLSGLFAYEGVAYWTNPASNATPLFRFYRPSAGTHFYTADAGERDRVISTLGATYAYEGAAYSVSAVPAEGAPTVWRFYRPSTGTHFYTADARERDTVQATLGNIYQLDGPAFWLGQ
ncbi:MAG: peptidoglycan DD-metalloendopeptidase family protein [Coriobacteriia bacterium]